ncbi:MocR-like pyridoxine biosynthesis transcription factor PdxR [Cellvibrio mixtus]|uniref:MocR-like pyridoxine biosynthesis transcription factor PdxR n=1 Tax=Cellvibrio mixtus TaxID=39650 RepID=UPI0005872010|nr:PLP-dependent aminotransferase family protein [Cellvibrio mixtus]
MEPVFALGLQVSRDTGNLVAQIYNQLSKAILQGRLAAGIAIPSSRLLARHLNVSRNTILQVYARLQSEGLLITQAGSKTLVAGIVTTLPHSTMAANFIAGIASHWQDTTLFAQPTGLPIEFNFSIGLADISTFPFETWRRAINRQYRKMENRTMEPGHPAGQPLLRNMIAKFISQSRAVSCSPENIFVCSGAQQAYTLLAQLFIKPGETAVAIESPGYPMARRAFVAAGARIFDVPVDGEGLLVDAIPSGVKIVFVTPTHQFPTSVPMSISRRMELLKRAKQRDMIIIEDDYDSEFRIGSQPIDALQTLDSEGRVFYVGTFSKCMFFDIRTGFIAAPEWAIPYLANARQAQDWRNPLTAQLALAEFMQTGELRRHISRMNRIYEQRYTAIIAGVNKYAKGILTPGAIRAGVHLTLNLHSDYPAKAVCEHALKQGLKIHCGHEFSVTENIPNQLMLGLGRIAQRNIEPAMQKLARCILETGKSHKN